MDVDRLARLRSPAGEAVLAAAAALVERGWAAADPLAATTELRRAGVDPELAGAALTQAVLRARASAKFGADASRMFFTRTGLEQGTRPAETPHVAGVSSTRRRTPRRGPSSSGSLTAFRRRC